MSSIYRKGRDGYFYYQTYLANKDTGRKDKKVFHSLGTKDRKEAEEKKLILDKKYHSTGYGFKWPFQLNFFSFLKIIASGSLIFLGMQFFKKPKIEIDEKKSSLVLVEKKPDTVNTVTSEAQLDNSTINNIFIGEKSIDKVVDNIALVDSISVNKSELRIPSYRIHRVEKLSSAFDQGKIFLTVNENYSSDVLKLICEKITKDYSEFSNIVICIYLNTEAGMRLALGENKTLASQLSKSAWIALYTFNNVEGAFFDDNPSAYLGSFE